MGRTDWCGVTGGQSCQRSISTPGSKSGSPSRSGLHHRVHLRRVRRRARSVEHIDRLVHLATVLVRRGPPAQIRPSPSKGKHGVGQRSHEHASVARPGRGGRLMADIQKRVSVGGARWDVRYRDESALRHSERARWSLPPSRSCGDAGAGIVDPCTQAVPALSARGRPASVGTAWTRPHTRTRCSPGSQRHGMPRRLPLP